MTAKYLPAWWLPGGHSMTLWGKIVRNRGYPATSRIRLTTPDQDFVDLVRLKAPVLPHAPRLLVLHGLEGGEQSHYMGGLLNSAQARGWGADVLLFRACGGELNHAARTYHSGETSDLEFVVSRVMQEFPDAPLLLAGVSLGGNVLLKWLGERSNAVPPAVVAAAAVSVPFDLARSCRNIERGFSRLYSWHFLRSLRRKALAKIAQHPGLASIERVRSSRTLWDFDDAFTSVAHGFRDAAEYYAKSSSLQFLPLIRVPTLLLSAYDDPFYPSGLLDEVAQVASANRSLAVELHDRGGHVGFVAGGFPWRADYYAERRVIGFLTEELARCQPSRPEGSQNSGLCAV